MCSFCKESQFRMCKLTYSFHTQWSCSQCRISYVHAAWYKFNFHPAWTEMIRRTMRVWSLRWKGNVLKCLIIQFKQSLQISLRFGSLYSCGYRFDFSSFKVLSFNLSLSNCISSMIPKASKITFLYYHAANYKTVHVIFHHWLDMSGRGRRLCGLPLSMLVSQM